MSREEFLRQLESCLLIGEEEKDEVMNYYSEYFEEAGSENEQAVIAELGDPESLARKLNLEFDADMSGQAQAYNSAGQAGTMGEDVGEEKIGGETTGYYHAGARQTGHYQNFSNLGTSIGDAVRAAVETALGVAGEAIDEARKATEGMFGEYESDAVAEAEEELRTVEEEAAESVRDAEEEVRSVEAEVKDARETVEEARAEVEVAMVELEAARQEVKAAREAVEAAMSAKEGLQGDEAVEAEEELKEAETELEEAEEALQDAEDALGDAIDARRDAESDLKDAERELREAKRAVETVRREGEREIRRARRELNAAMREVERESRGKGRRSENMTCDSGVEIHVSQSGDTADTAGNATVFWEPDEKTAEELKHAKENIRQAAQEIKQAGRQIAKEAGAVTGEMYQGSKGVFTSLKDILWGGSSEQEYYCYTDEDMEPFTSAMVDVNNCPIRVERSETGRFGVDVRLLVRPDDQVIVNVENGVLKVKKIRGSKWITMLGNVGANQYVKLYLPDMEYDRLDLDTSNAAVMVSNVSRIRELLNIDTSNGSIKVEGVLVDDRIKLDTSNASINVKQACCKALEADSSNGGIVLEQVASMRATLDTSNGGIKVKNCEINELLNADTSNGGIEVLLSGSESDYGIVADTSNAKVYVNGRNMGSHYTTQGGMRRLRLDTSNGRITIGFVQ